MIRIFHQKEKCIGCAYCEEVAPNTWKMNEKDGKCILINSHSKKNIYMLITSDDEYESNLEAQELCPVNIIRVEKIKK